MDKLQAIYTEPTACQDCYKCLRECPVKAIQIQEGHARVVGSLCVNCGHCVEVCPQKAKKVRSDLERAKILVKIKPKAVLSIAPSFAAEFPGVPLRRFVAGMKALGFHAVSETSIGADLVSEAMRRDIEGKAPRIVISSACPSAVQYIHKYMPDMAGTVAEVCSPMIAHGRYLKKMLGEETAVIFAGPCIAKKREADCSEGAVDVALTFGELRAWLAEEGIDLAAEGEAALSMGAASSRAAYASGDGFFPKRSNHGALYPIEGGMVASLKHAGLADVDCMTFSGIRQIKEAVQDLAGYAGGSASAGVSAGVDAGADAGPEAGAGAGMGAGPEAGALSSALSGGKTLFLELLACEGGCINGPLSARRSGTASKRLNVLSYVSARARDGGENRAERREMGGETSDSNLAFGAPGSLAEEPVREGAVDAEKERLALASIGKYGHKDELNCSGCGYDSCRAFARAMVLGKAEKTMCVSYMRNLAQKKANALLMTMPSAAVIVDSSMKIVESNKPFAELVGPDAMAVFEVRPTLEDADLKKLVPFWQSFEDVIAEDRPDSLTSDFRLNDKVIHGTVFCIEKGLLAAGLFQDITVPWIQKDRVIQQAKRVMDQNLKTVQKIAYLLGENAADSESALTSIIESFRGQGSKDPADSTREGSR